MRAAPPPRRSRRPGKRWGLRVFFVLLLLVMGACVAARITFTLIPPHRVIAERAILSDAKRAQLEELLEIERPLDRDQAIDLALDFTAKSLSFSLDHKTSYDFAPGSRPGNCVEYAALFAAVFDATAKRAGSTARAWHVRSDARVFGKRLPLRSLADHDWVLVQDPADGARIFVDPALSDAWLGATLARNVKGGDKIELPK